MENRFKANGKETRQQKGRKRRQRRQKTKRMGKAEGEERKGKWGGSNEIVCEGDNGGKKETVGRR